MNIPDKISIRGKILLMYTTLLHYEDTAYEYE